MHADKEPEPLNLGVPVVNFPRANAILARAQALLWVRDCSLFQLKLDVQDTLICKTALHLRNLFQLDSQIMKQYFDLTLQVAMLLILFCLTPDDFTCQGDSTATN